MEDLAEAVTRAELVAKLEAELNQPLEKLLAEARGQKWRPVLRTCRNGHAIRSEWDQTARGECRVCANIAKARSVPPSPSGDLADFWALVDASGDCWLWTGAKAKGGYGRWRGWATHRLAYEATVGPIPAGLQIDHLCMVPGCCNPDHLEPVTAAENSRRRVAAEAFLNVHPQVVDKS